MRLALTSVAPHRHAARWARLALPATSSRPELNVAYTQAEPIMSYGWRGTDDALYLDTQGGSTVKAGGVLTSGATINAYWNGGYQRETYVRGANSALYRYLDDGTATPGKWEALGGKFT